MNVKHAAACAVLWLLAATAMTQPSGDVPNAQKAAEQWLASTDTEQYGASWDAAAAVFQSKITRVNWINALTNVRMPLGKLLSRTLMSADYRRTIPGAPDGDYVVIQYRTQFENKPTATELVTPVKEKDGTWRVSGYFIR